MPTGSRMAWLRRPHISCWHRRTASEKVGYGSPTRRRLGAPSGTVILLYTGAAGPTTKPLASRKLNRAAAKLAHLSSAHTSNSGHAVARGLRSASGAQPNKPGRTPDPLQTIERTGPEVRLVGVSRPVSGGCNIIRFGHVGDRNVPSRAVAVPGRHRPEAARVHVDGGTARFVVGLLTVSLRRPPAQAGTTVRSWLRHQAWRTGNLPRSLPRPTPTGA